MCNCSACNQYTLRSEFESENEYENAMRHPRGQVNDVGLLQEFASYETPVLPTTLSMRKEETSKSKQPVHARILWPALGFPAVISPRQQPVESPMLDSDATKCICLLLLSDREYLSKEEAARYLRITKWDDRRRRHIDAGEFGSFPETAISVKNDLPWPKNPKPELLKLTLPGWKDNYGENGPGGTGISFGGDREGLNAIVVKLSDYVRSFYASVGLKYLHEIRISEYVSTKLNDGQYNIFWNNENKGENAHSSEMKLLLDRFAVPRRNKIGNLWNKASEYLMKEYEYEYGFHRPYNKPQARTEILHPLFIQRSSSDNLRIGHLTDLHINTRTNVYEENCKKLSGKQSSIQFNNWNRNFEAGYNNAKKDSDILLMTGDLIDYGRGYWGLNEPALLGNNNYYHPDRDWFLFYYLLASGQAYSKPVYTSLGNHDWRINPYPPFAPGAPGFNSLVHNHGSFSNSDERDAMIRTMHGPGYDRRFSYQLDGTGKFGQGVAALKSVFTNAGLKSRLPIATSIDSIKWYLLSINPFLDYSCALPGGQKLMMLDWADQEDLFFEDVVGGKKYIPTSIDALTLPGPMAKNALTTIQKKLTETFVSSPGNAKIVGLHMPPIGPYPDWSDEDLMRGQKIYGPNEQGRGPNTYATKLPDGTIKQWNGHPFFATLPSTDDLHYGTAADYGSFQKERTWFLQRMADPKSGVRVVLSGHIHRNGLYYIHTPVAAEKAGPAITGKMMVKSLYTPGSQIKGIGLANFKKDFPLYLNTTSLGPRGGFYSRKLTDAERKAGGLTIHPGYTQIDLLRNGTINRIEFRTIGAVAAPVTTKPITAKPGANVKPKIQHEFFY